MAHSRHLATLEYRGRYLFFTVLDADDRDEGMAPGSRKRLLAASSEQHENSRKRQRTSDSRSGGDWGGASSGDNEDHGQEYEEEEDEDEYYYDDYQHNGDEYNESYEAHDEADGDGDGDGDHQYDRTVAKYWAQRYLLFSRFDEGIKMDTEGWYSVTPEWIAAHIATRCKCAVIIDAFCGVGGNTIQFAMQCERVIAIDIDRNRLEIARHNARVYGVEHKIDFIHGDYMKLAAKLTADVVFLAPPWGGPSYAACSEFSLRMTTPNSVKIYEKTLSITRNIALYLPKNTSTLELLQLKNAPHCEVEAYNAFGNIKACTVYFGDALISARSSCRSVVKFTYNEQDHHQGSDNEG